MGSFLTPRLCTSKETSVCRVLEQEGGVMGWGEEKRGDSHALPKDQVRRLPRCPTTTGTSVHVGLRWCGYRRGLTLFEFRLGENWGTRAGESQPPVYVSCQPCSPAGLAGLTIKQIHVSSA